jgi:hypothetical protein
MPSVGFEPRDPSSQTVSDLRLGPRGHRDLLVIDYLNNTAAGVTLRELQFTYNE